VPRSNVSKRPKADIAKTDPCCSSKLISRGMVLKEFDIPAMTGDDKEVSPLKWS
jgi:hypothetical protein